MPVANGTISTFLANKIQDNLLGGLNYGPPTLNLGYSTTASAANGFGTEPVGANYGRVGTPPAVWQVAADGTTTNIADIECPRSSGNQGSIVCLNIYDSSVAGNPLSYIPIDGSIVVQNRNSVVIPAGAIVHRFKAGGSYSQYWKAAIMNFLYLGAPLPIEPVLWAGYTTTAPSATASGTEPTADEYARLSVNNNKVSFSTAVNSEVALALDLLFPESVSAQGTATYLALFGSEDGGPYLASALLSPAASLPSGSQLIVRANSAVFKLK